MSRLVSTIKNYINAESDCDSLVYENRMMIDNVIPVCLVLAVFISVFFMSEGFDVRQIASNTGIFLLYALFLYIVKERVRSERLKSRLLLVSYSLFLTFLVLSYYTLIGYVVWTISAVFLILSIGRNGRSMIIVTSAIILLLPFYLWFRYPGTLNRVHFVSQYVAFICLITMASVVKNILDGRYRLVKQHLHETNIILKLSSEMIAVNSDSIRHKVRHFLEIISMHCGADRANVFLLSTDGSQVNNYAEWCAPGIGSVNSMMTYISVCESLLWNKQKSEKIAIGIADIDELEPTPPEKKVLRSDGIKSIISVPIIRSEKVCGFITFHTVRRQNNWPPNQKRIMSVLANMLSDAFFKIDKEKEIRHMAYYDTLTGLPNRFSFNTKLDDTIANADIHNNKIAVLFVDLDSFKSVNDTMGHEIGDVLLCRVSQNLISALGPNDFAARFGGDEFVVLLTDFDGQDDLRQRTEALMSAICEPLVFNKREFFVTASSGISVYPEDGADRDTLIKSADIAMYYSKGHGKNHITLCSPEMKAAVEEKVHVTHMLYKALQNNELVLHYQPQVDLATKQIVGVEALIRWNHPELGMLMPSYFIPLAEQSGLIVPMGKWIFETACRQNKLWQDMGLPPMRMAVNFSVEQFYNSNIVQMFKDILSETCLDGKYIEMEITESIAVKDGLNIQQILADLKTLGISVSLDDFGTEYSSLARIKQLPIDRLKMAMEFVNGITADSKDAAIAKVILSLAQNLELKVIAEGVETKEQEAVLKNLKCDEVQGFYFHRPMPAEEIEKLLRETAKVS